MPRTSGIGGFAQWVPTEKYLISKEEVRVNIGSPILSNGHSEVQSELQKFEERVPSGMQHLSFTHWFKTHQNVERLEVLTPENRKS